MANSDLFKDLPAEITREIVLKGHVVEIPVNKFVFRQGDVADALWVIVQGTCRAVADGQAVRDMQASDIFGEVGVLRRSVRTADVATITPVILLRVSTDHLWEVLSHNLNLGLAIQSLARKRLFGEES